MPSACVLEPKWILTVERKCLGPLITRLPDEQWERVRVALVDVLGLELSRLLSWSGVVPIATPLLPLLQAAKERRESPWGDVAVTVHGKPWSDTGLLQALKRAQARVRLKGWGVHSLRHFFVTELCRRGAPTMVVKQLAGHSGLSTT